MEGSRRRAAALLVVATAVLLGTGAVTAHAQLGGVPPIGPAPTAPSDPTTTDPQSSPSTTTTTTSRPQLVGPAPAPSAPQAGGGSTTTTTAPGPPPTDPAATEPLPAAGGDGGGTPQNPGAFPPELQAMVNSVKRTAPNSTKQLLAALAPLAQYGLDPTQQALVGFGRFPVAGEASWTDDWWLPRFGPVWRLHQGVDIFAPTGTPVRAPVDGLVRITNGGLGGLAVYVREGNGTYWYMCHLSALAPDLVEGMSVKTGQVVGFVGTSGNAQGGPSHLHFEVHPNGGPAVPPKPVIDRFVADALSLVPQLLDSYAKAHANVAQAPALPAPVVPVAPEPLLDSPSSLSPRAALLWASAANPAGGTLKLAEADALAAVGRIDWASVAAAAADRAAAVRASRALLMPLTPMPLARAAGWAPPAPGPRTPPFADAAQGT